nr:hypothetical protein GCM10020092_021830 [Actinoplanes digitatis]
MWKLIAARVRSAAPGRPASRTRISGAVGMTGLEAFRSRGSQSASRMRKYFAVSSSGNEVRVASAEPSGG